MTLLADFNLEDDRGRTPIVLDPSVLVQVGETVLVADKEGNRCKAIVAEVASRQEDGEASLIAFVVPKPEAPQPSSEEAPVRPPRRRRRGRRGRGGVATGGAE